MGRPRRAKWADWAKQIGAQWESGASALIGRHQLRARPQNWGASCRDKRWIDGLATFLLTPLFPPPNFSSTRPSRPSARSGPSSGEQFIKGLILHRPPHSRPLLARREATQLIPCRPDKHLRPAPLQWAQPSKRAGAARPLQWEAAARGFAAPAGRQVSELSAPIGSTSRPLPLDFHLHLHLRLPLCWRRFSQPEKVKPHPLAIGR